jgi:hypothetical protein
VITVHRERGLERGAAESGCPRGLRRDAATAKAAGRLRIHRPAEPFPMEAIGVILLFVAAFAVLNRVEFGRFD